jgi:hypothetical protein
VGGCFLDQMEDHIPPVINNPPGRCDLDTHHGLIKIKGSSRVTELSTSVLIELDLACFPTVVELVNQSKAGSMDDRRRRD